LEGGVVDLQAADPFSAGADDIWQAVRHHDVPVGGPIRAVSPVASQPSVRTSERSPKQQGSFKGVQGTHFSYEVADPEVSVCSRRRPGRPDNSTSPR
jgi:hypothetical protein